MDPRGEAGILQQNGREFLAEIRVSGMKKWECVVCGFIYDEAEGLPEEGIVPGTRWEDIPEDWACPECGVSKADFEMLELEV
jgi:rubredoxin